MFDLLKRVRKEDRLDKIVKQNGMLEKQIGVLLQSIETYHIATQSANEYKTRTAQIAETRKKYNGTALFGNQIAQRLINLRVAFSVPNRLFLTKSSSTQSNEAMIKDVKKYLSDFMTLNGLDAAIPRDLCREAELNGQVAVRLVWDPTAKLPRLIYYPYGAVNYTVKTAKDSDKYLINAKLTFEYRMPNTTTPKTLTDDNFSFIAFNDELGVYEGYPTLGGILVTIENVDKDLIDWRTYNHLFAHPTPHFKCETKEEADAISTMITGTGWRVGTAIATNSEFSLKGTTGVESNVLMMAIQTGAKIISGHTGIGIHFLGFANVMSNRATADSMGEPTEVVLHSEIASWNSFYKDLFNKAIRLRNRHLQRKYDEGAVDPKIVPLTDRQWAVIKDIYLPLLEKKVITRDTLLEKIPDIDADDEIAKLEAEAERVAKETPEVKENGEEEEPGEEENE